MPYLCNWRNLDSRSCILQRETVLVLTPQPQCVFAQERSACLFLTQPNAPPGPRRVWAASGSVGTATWRVVSTA